MGAALVLVIAIFGAILVDIIDNVTGFTVAKDGAFFIHQFMTAGVGVAAGVAIAGRNDR